MDLEDGSTCVLQLRECCRPADEFSEVHKEQPPIVFGEWEASWSAAPGALGNDSEWPWGFCARMHAQSARMHALAHAHTCARSLTLAFPVPPAPPLPPVHPSAASRPPFRLPALARTMRRSRSGCRQQPTAVPVRAVLERSLGIGRKC